MAGIQNLLNGLNLGAQGRGASAQSPPLPDTAETVHISSLALLKMLKHGRAGVPMEVMGLMLGKFVDDYTVQVVDVFAMPQSGTGVSVESVDEVFQKDMMDKLQLTGRAEYVVGWYHSHPGFGCWLSSTDCQTQQSFEQLNKRAVAVVIDPIQSVKGKVVIDAFRLIAQQQAIFSNSEPRQSTSVVGHLNKPSIQARIRGLDRSYYSLNIDYRKNALEMKMLSNVHAKRWASGITSTGHIKERSKTSEATIERMLKLTKDYNDRIKDEESKTQEELALLSVGKIDPRRHLKDYVKELMSDNVDLALGLAIDTVAF